jgi:hypothetical protein
MILEYSHSYEDPDTGQLVDVMVSENDEPRNVRVGFRDLMRQRQRDNRDRRDHRSRPRTGGGGTRVVVRPSGGHPLAPVGPTGPMGPQYGHIGPYGYVGPASGSGVSVHGDFVTVKKSALTELIPAVGKVWASFLGRPEPPTAVGDDVVDRDNAAAHRDALARHQQNQTRILALSDLAERALKLFA